MPAHSRIRVWVRIRVRVSSSSSIRCLLTGALGLWRETGLYGVFKEVLARDAWNRLRLRRFKPGVPGIADGLRNNLIREVFSVGIDLGHFHLPLFG